jgi:hypothetical protein
MLGQAAAVLVSLSTLVTLEITPSALLSVLHQVLALTGSSHSRLFKILLILINIIVLIVVNGTLTTIRLST